MKNLVIILSAIAIAFSACVKDRNSPTSTGPVNINGKTLIHYWSCNHGDSSQLNNPDTTIGGGSISYSAWYVDTVHPGSSLNLRMTADSGGAIRMRNPFGYMLIKAPTSGYKQAVLTMAIERSNSGPAVNNVLYTTDGTTFLAAPTSSISLGITWSLVSCDFSSIAATDNNPNFAIKLVPASGNTGTTGNDRYDNISIDATKQ